MLWRSGSSYIFSDVSSRSRNDIEHDAVVDVNITRDGIFNIVSSDARDSGPTRNRRDCGSESYNANSARRCARYIVDCRPRTASLQSEFRSFSISASVGPSAAIRLISSKICSRILLDFFAGFWQREDVQRRWSTTLVNATFNRDNRFVTLHEFLIQPRTVAFEEQCACE